MLSKEKISVDNRYSELSLVDIYFVKDILVGKDIKTTSSSYTIIRYHE